MDIKQNIKNATEAKRQLRARQKEVRACVTKHPAKKAVSIVMRQERNKADE